MYQFCSKIKNQIDTKSNQCSYKHTFLLINRHRITVVRPPRTIAVIVPRPRRRTLAPPPHRITNIAAAPAAATTVAVAVEAAPARTASVMIQPAAAAIRGMVRWVRPNGCYAAWLAQAIYPDHGAP